MYNPPYTIAEIQKKYPRAAAKLIKDQAHRWRAETGIELIHKEPTREELKRIWRNWQEMSKEQKEMSDEKSMEFFGIRNKEHYLELIGKY